MRIASLLALVVTMAACQPKPATPGHIAPLGEAIATVDGKTITKGSYDKQMGQMKQMAKDQMGEERFKAAEAMGQFKQMGEQIYIGEALYNRAIADKTLLDADAKFKLNMAARQTIIGLYMDKVAKAAATEEEIKKMYDSKAVQYQEAKASHILIKSSDKAPPAEDAKAKAKAVAILAEVKGGANFADVAKQKSEGPSKSKGGDLGWFTKGKMVKEFSDATFAAKKGDIIGPVKTRFGYHVILVDDMRTTPLEKVKPQLENELKKAAFEKIVNDIKATIELKETATDAKKGDAKKEAPNTADIKMPHPAHPGHNKEEQAKKTDTKKDHGHEH